MIKPTSEYLLLLGHVIEIVEIFMSMNMDDEALKFSITTDNENDEFVELIDRFKSDNAEVSF